MAKHLNQSLFFIILFFFFGLIILIAAAFLIEPEVIEITPLPNKTQAHAPVEKKEISIIFVGDIMLNRGVKHMIDKHGEGDFKFPFLKIADYLKKADIVFGNLESVISDKGTKAGSMYSFRAKPEAIEGLVFAGFDIVSVANNHVFDYGRLAMEDSFLRLKEAGIAYVGGGFSEEEAYAPIIKEIDGVKIAFLAYTNLGSIHWTAKEENSGIAWLEKDRVEKDIKEARDQADLIIVSFHYGDEYQLKPNSFQISISQAAIDAGADLVIGHHPHVVQPVEIRQLAERKGYIAYSLGNFIFDQDFSEETMKGLILKVIIKERKIKEVITIETEINQYYQPEIIVRGEPENQVQEETKQSYPTTVRHLSEDYSGQQVKCIYSVSGVPSPKGVAFTPDGQEFWVTSLMNKKRGVVVFDAKTGKHKKDIILPDGGGVEIIFNSAGSRAYVSQMETARVFEIKTETKEILRTFDTKSSWTKVLALSPGEDVIYASNWVDNNVSIIDLQNGQLIRNVPAVTTPRGIYPTKDGTILYVAGFDNGEIQKIKLETGTSSVLHKSGGAMRHIAADEEKEIIYFSDMGKGLIFKLDMKTDKVEQFAKTDTNPNTIVLTPDKKILIVSNRGANHPSGQINISGPEKGTILFFDTSSDEKIATLVGGNQPTALDVSPDGRYFIYSNFLDGNLTMCEIPFYKE